MAAVAAGAAERMIEARVPSRSRGRCTSAARVSWPSATIGRHESVDHNGLGRGRVARSRGDIAAMCDSAVQHAVCYKLWFKSLLRHHTGGTESRIFRNLNIYLSCYPKIISEGYMRPAGSSDIEAVAYIYGRVADEALGHAMARNAQSAFVVAAGRARGFGSSRRVSTGLHVTRGRGKWTVP